jgi:hypothetical protein
MKKKNSYPESLQVVAREDLHATFEQHLRHIDELSQVLNALPVRHTYSTSDYKTYKFNSISPNS